ncbi:iron ABC transporter ATP-binding protein [Agromyces luteolus]|uniref:ATP-binding cassette domain-containing protein n=1 Tax=Agromyces luteolus TaxID=88373 RepID=A0A7C9HFU6_9MICO|nr:ATP-binding cassette domain-containing protein [Agromyces luteolus]MUN05706.1 ATP-binding cassette domain-containing protein [Agromyces luteolus]GLK26251.1 iron ABC transporter ATP-binding protein [Agromyces luteolus]
MITVASATKRYGRTAVVDDVALELGDVGVTAIIGANGAGKSTLLSLIGRLLPLDSGRIEIDGLDVGATKGDVLARLVAVLRQENHLTARLTVRDLVGFGRFPHGRGRIDAAGRAAIEEAIAYLDLEPLAERFLDELSGGQRQRAFIAMALAQDTRYLLLDEPLNSLDLRHAVEIMRLLRRLAAERGTRVVVVLHDLNFAAAHADRIIAMRDGRVIADGPPASVMRSEVLEAVYDLPIDVREIDGARVGLYFR